MNDDLNAPRAVAALFDFVREANRLLDGSKSAGPELRAVWAWAAQVLDVAAAPAGRLERHRRRRAWLFGDVDPPAGREAEMGLLAGRIERVRGQEGTQLQAGR